MVVAFLSSSIVSDNAQNTKFERVFNMCCDSRGWVEVPADLDPGVDPHHPAHRPDVGPQYLLLEGRLPLPPQVL